MIAQAFLGMGSRENSGGGHKYANEKRGGSYQKNLERVKFRHLVGAEWGGFYINEKVEGFGKGEKSLGSPRNWGPTQGQEGEISTITSSRQKVWRTMCKKHGGAI